MKLHKPVVTALIVGAGMLQLAPPALAAPGAPQHPATFLVQCDGIGEVTLLEATGTATFTANSPRPGNNAVILSAQGGFYEGVVPDPATLIYSFEKTWGTKTGISNHIHCARVNTEYVNGHTYTAFESFVLGLLPGASQ
ncbi:MAG: hypothetical protein WCF36_07590 [Candidatus Nanopelagicales bacterium]